MQLSVESLQEVGAAARPPSLPDVCQALLQVCNILPSTHCSLGVPFDIGESLDEGSAQTCFCSTELCNTVDFTSSGLTSLPSLVLLLSLLGVLCL